jgi:polar amino acid transport system permease protein
MPEEKATPPELRMRDKEAFDLRSHLRTFSQVAQAVLVFAILGFVIWRGAEAMDYRWQWYRVTPLVYRFVDGEFVAGPLLKGLGVTLKLSVIGGVLAILIGFATAFARLSDSIGARILSKIYLEAIRNTPLLVQLFLFYFVLAPIFGVGRFWTGVLALALYEGSFAAEIIRGGITGVARGQYEGADAIGLSVVDKYRYIVIPQSMPLILPPLTGVFISLIKSSAIVSVIAVAELTTTALNLISDTFMAFEIWFVTAGIYLVVTVALSMAVSAFEASLNKHNRR